MSVALMPFSRMLRALSAAAAATLRSRPNSVRLALDDPL
jgi:hypothetical protein